MKSITVFAALIVTSMLQTCVAAPVRMLNIPGNALPGQLFAFDVRIPTTTSLAAYQIDITLTSSNGTAGTDFFFGAVNPASPLAEYVFDSTANFATANNLDPANTQRLSISDFDLTGISTVEGVNDRIAIVTVQTLSSYTGNLQVAIDPTGLILDGPDFATPVPEFALTQSDTAAAGATSIGITAIPEPGSACLLILASIAIVGSRRRGRQALLKTVAREDSRSK